MEIGESAGAAPPGDGGAAPSSSDGSSTSGQTEVQLIDELGMPMKNIQVRVTTLDGSTTTLTTDDDGKIRPSLPPLSLFWVGVDDAHESRWGDASVTPSGHHFALGGNPPDGESGAA